jgi:hypothetical protein
LWNKVQRCQGTRLPNWRKQYNEDRPHSSLDYRTPSEFAGPVNNNALREWKNAYGVPHSHNASNFS